MWVLGACVCCVVEPLGFVLLLQAVSAFVVEPPGLGLLCVVLCCVVTSGWAR